jgi:acyl-CoA synthetase (AMP-forming)/AMP-acid ligase II/acyl carrier protein
MAAPSNLMEILRFWAERNGERRVYTFQRDDGHETTLDYGDLDRRARAIAALLQRTCRPGDRALLLYPAGLDFITAFCGCAYAGVLAVPVCYPKPKRPMPRLESISRDAQPRVALTNRKTLDQFDFHLIHSDLSREAWIASDDAPDSLAAEWTAPNLAADDLAFLQYTSGSTSEPKGVMVSHGNLLHNLEAIRRGFGIDFDLQPDEPRNNGVFWLPAYHDMGLIGGILTAMYVGGHSLLMSPSAFLQRPARWLESIHQTRARISGAPNFAFDLCVAKVPAEKRAELDLSSWEICFCGAEPIRAQSLETFAETFRESGFRREAFYPCYGLAENTLMAAGGEGPSPLHVETVRRDALAENRAVEADVDQAAQEIVCCGGPVFDQQVVIVDPATSRCREAGEIGEIWIKGDSVAQGYWKRPEESREVFQARLEGGDGPYLRTGDLGFLLQGKLYVTGRLKDVIILRGRNHYPQDIERTVECCHEALRPNAGVAVAIEVHGEESLVVIQEVDRGHRDADLSEIIRRIRRAVSDEHEIQPHAIVLIRHASLPVTTSGKVQRSLARRLYLAGELKVLQEWVAPQYGAVAFRNSSTFHAATHENGHGHAHAPGNGKASLNGRHVNGKGHANGHSQGNGHLHANGNGHVNGNGNGKKHVNGSGNGHVNGNGHSAAKGPHRGMASAAGNGHAHASTEDGAHGAAAVNGAAKRSTISRIQFEHFPLAAEEIDRLAERIERWILDWMIEHAAVSAAEIDRHKPFAEYGMDSLTAVELSHQLEEWLGVELTAVIAWNYPTPHKISQYLARTVGGVDTAEATIDSPQESASRDDFERLLAEIENLSESEAQDALARDDSSD